MLRHHISGWLLTVLLLFAATTASHAEDRYKPFVLASKQSGDISTVVKATRDALTKNGFKIAGSYSPYPKTTLLIVTHDALRQAAAQSEFGGYAAGQRVSVSP